MLATAPELEKINNTLLLALSSQLFEDDANRINLSRHLHKEVAGGVVAGLSIVETIRHEIEVNGNMIQLLALLNSLESTQRLTLQIVRIVTQGLFPAILKAFGLKVALQQLVQKMEEDFSLPIISQLSGDESALDQAKRLNIFHIVQLILDSAIKKGVPTWLELTCQFSDLGVEIVIDHDGCHSAWIDWGIDMVVIEARCLSLGSHAQFIRVEPDGISRARVSTVSLPKTKF